MTRRIPGRQVRHSPIVNGQTRFPLPNDPPGSVVGPMPGGPEEAVMPDREKVHGFPRTMRKTGATMWPSVWLGVAPPGLHRGAPSCMRMRRQTLTDRPSVGV